MDPGYYTNFFVVDLENFTEAGILRGEVSTVGTARELRSRLPCHVVQIDTAVYAYGSRSAAQDHAGFSAASSEDVAEPRLMSRLIVDGLLDKMVELGYTVDRRRIANRAYHPGRAISTSVPNIKLVPGCIVRSSYFNDQLAEKLIYGVIIDPWFRLELDGRPSNFGEIREVAPFV
jgi:hypothetical protein